MLVPLVLLSFLTIGLTLFLITILISSKVRRGLAKAGLPSIENWA
jgi:hypothetical protein